MKTYKKPQINVLKIDENDNLLSGSNAVKSYNFDESENSEENEEIDNSLTRKNFWDE